MAYQKGQKVEEGIWRLADSKDYLAEVTVRDPHTGQRIRERKTVNRLDLARAWIRTKKADADRDKIQDRKKITLRPFSAFADEYLEKWSKVKEVM